ncbi:hypothetical protein TNCV_4244421 [Trichonephila clavipes]|nr:hypothetical protein TNCV_4244421 [Trichonephila clavipes]
MGYSEVMIVLEHLMVQGIRQGVVIQIPEMGQHFQDYGKKYQFFKGFSLFRSFDDNETFTSSGQVAKLAPDAEGQVFQGLGSGQVVLQAERLINVPVGSAVFGGRIEVGMIHRDKNHFRVFAVL